jgi:hypothetical protein
MIDSATLVDRPQETVRWAPDDTYAQAHSNKLASRNMRGVYEVLVKILFLDGATVVPIIHYPKQGSETLEAQRPCRK